jgi:hypothetical protein
LPVVGVELETRRAPGSFVFQADNKKVVETYKLAVKVIEGNIKPWQRGLLTTTKPALMAGKGYASPWTRDASYNTFFCAGLIYPQVAKNTLLSVLIKENGTVRIGGQYWDCVSWITGACPLMLLSTLWPISGKGNSTKRRDFSVVLAGLMVWEVILNRTTTQAAVLSYLIMQSITSTWIRSA